jgi:hypothetical protein
VCEPAPYIVERTPWVPAADFDEQAGIDGVNLQSGYGSMTRGEGAHLRCPLRASPASRRQARAAICDGPIVVLVVQHWQRERRLNLSPRLGLMAGEERHFDD